MHEKNQYSMRNITGEKVTEYIERKYAPLNQKMWRMRLECENRYVPIIQRDVETMLISYLNIHRPDRILEIGTAVGYSATVMSDTLPQAHIVTLERDEDMYAKAVETVRTFGKEKSITVIKGDAGESLDMLLASVRAGEREPFDFVFIDAGKSHYCDFWKTSMGMIRKGGVIFADNVLMRGMTVDDSFDEKNKHRTNIRKMREFIDMVTGSREVQTALLPVGDGVTVSYVL